jgi:hypothetical protein
MKVWFGTGEALLCTAKAVKKLHISHRVKLQACREGVGGAHNTEDFADNKTANREGALLYSSFWRR